MRIDMRRVGRAALWALPLVVLALPVLAQSAGGDAAAGTAAAAPGAPAAAAEAKIDTGDTAWMLTSTALVLMMTIPGLALFYAGMVRKKNVLATMMQSFSICALVTVLWMVVGYSLAFTNGSPYIGDMSRLLLRGIEATWDKPFTLGAGTDNSTANTIPETVFIMFQMTFAIITPALIAGAFADRMKFSAMMVFMALWSLLVYSPIAHWVWSPLGLAQRPGRGRLRRRHRGAHQRGRGRSDVCAGARQAARIRPGQHGAVQSVLCGDRRRAAVGRLVRLQRRVRGGRRRAAPAWRCWRPRSRPAAPPSAGCSPNGSSRASRRCWAPCRARWPAWSPSRRRRASCCRVRGCAIGVIAGIVCFWSATSLKHMLGYDDSLDAFGVHGVGGIVGALLTGVFAYGPLSATADHADGVYIGGVELLKVQCYAVLATVDLQRGRELGHPQGHRPDHGLAGRGRRGTGRAGRGAARGAVGLTQGSALDLLGPAAPDPPPIEERVTNGALGPRFCLGGQRRVPGRGEARVHEPLVLRQRRDRRPVRVVQRRSAARPGWPAGFPAAPPSGSPPRRPDPAAISAPPAPASRRACRAIACSASCSASRPCASGA